MFAAGAKVPTVVKELGVPRGTAYRWHQEWRNGRP
jgi:hypothetical protein